MTDLQTLEEALISLAAAVITAAIPVLIGYIHVRFHIANDSDVARTLQATADAAAKLADSYAHSHDLTGYQTEQAIQVGVNHVLTTQPDAIARFGKSEADVRTMVVARMVTSLPAETVRQAAPLVAV